LNYCFFKWGPIAWKNSSGLPFLSIGGNKKYSGKYREVNSISKSKVYHLNVNLVLPAIA
jgi:hypothetical protein